VASLRAAVAGASRVWALKCHNDSCIWMHAKCIVQCSFVVLLCSKFNFKSHHDCPFNSVGPDLHLLRAEVLEGCQGALIMLLYMHLCVDTGTSRTGFCYTYRYALLTYVHTGSSNDTLHARVIHPKFQDDFLHDFLHPTCILAYTG
jgi:hypothetical protein